MTREKEVEVRWNVDYSRYPHHARRLKAALEEHIRKQEAKEKVGLRKPT